jgi:hypothetical protein
MGKGSKYYFKDVQMELGSVAHASTPSCFGSHNQEDCDSRIAQAKSFRDPISTNKSWMCWHVRVILGRKAA